MKKTEVRTGPRKEGKSLLELQKFRISLIQPNLGKVSKIHPDSVISLHQIVGEIEYHN
jgi:hypothetical protein